MQAKLNRLLERYQAGTIRGTYIRRVKVLILNNQTRVRC